MRRNECYRELKHLDTELPILLASGFPKGADVQSLLTLSNVRYLQKPYEIDDLVAHLTELEEVYRDSIHISCQVNLVRASKSIAP
jgi:ActR/RegA family two-component response regulator